MTRFSKRLSMFDNTNKNIRKKIKICESENEHFWKKTFDARWYEWKYEKTKASISENDLIVEVSK